MRETPAEGDSEAYSRDAAAQRAAAQRSCAWALRGSRDLGGLSQGCLAEPDGSSSRERPAPRTEDTEAAYAEAVKKRRAALRAIFTARLQTTRRKVPNRGHQGGRTTSCGCSACAPSHVRQEDGTRDKLMSPRAADENEDKMLSFEEFRHASWSREPGGAAAARVGRGAGASDRRVQARGRECKLSPTANRGYHRGLFGSP